MTLLAACGGGGGGGGGRTSSEGQVVLEVGAVNLFIGESTEFTVTVRDSGGRPVANASVTVVEDVVASAHVTINNGSGRTDGNGRFSGTIVATSFGTARLVAQARAGDGSLIGSAELGIAVFSRTVFTVTPTLPEGVSTPTPTPVPAAQIATIYMETDVTSVSTSGGRVNVLAIAFDEDNKGVNGVQLLFDFTPRVGILRPVSTITRPRLLEQAEPFVDANSNGKYDAEPFRDENNNLRFDPGEDFTDLNNNGNYDAETFTDSNGNRRFDDRIVQDGVAEVQIEIPANTAVQGTVMVTATAANVTGSVSFFIVSGPPQAPPATVLLQLGTTTCGTDAGGSVGLTAYVFDANNIGLNGVNVLFITTVGRVIPLVAVTARAGAQDGVATATLQVDRGTPILVDDNGNIVAYPVRARAGGVEGANGIFIVPGRECRPPGPTVGEEQEPANVLLSASPTRIRVRGSGSREIATISATVIDSSGGTLSNTSVRYYISDRSVAQGAAILPVNFRHCSISKDICRTDADCSDGETCTGSCSPPRRCNQSDPCPSGETCNTDSFICEVGTVCQAERDCPSGQTCIDSTCVSAPLCLSNAECPVPGQVCSGVDLVSRFTSVTDLAGTAQVQVRSGTGLGPVVIRVEVPTKIGDDLSEPCTNPATPLERCIIAEASLLTVTAGQPGRISLSLNNVFVDNNDGTLTTTLAATITDSRGNTVEDGTAAFFEVVPMDAEDANARKVAIVGSSVTFGDPPCDTSQFQQQTGIPITAQPGDAITCVKFPMNLQGADIQFRAETLAGVEYTDILTLPTRGLPNDILLSASPRVVQVTDTEGASILVRAEVLDRNGEALQNARIRFLATDPEGNVLTFSEPIDFSDASGFATATLLVPAGTAEGLIRIQAFGAGIPLALAETTNVEVDSSGSTPGQPGEPNAIIFSSASPSEIGVRGSQRVQQSVVTFRVVDVFGEPVANVPVAFFLSGLGGERLSQASGVTDENGQVTTAVTSGTRAAPIQLTAAIDKDGDSVPDLVTSATVVNVVGGTPTFHRMSTAAQFLNISGRVTFGLRDVISAFLNDRFGNAVPAGTVVNFVSNGASVFDQTPTDRAGVASATLISEGGVPPNGIVTVLAVTRGEEPFIDSTGNGVYDSGEVFTDIPEPFIDFNRNGRFDTPEPFNDLNTNGQRDADEPFTDVNGNHEYDAHEFERFVDTNGNGQWDPQQNAGIWDSNAFIWSAIPVTLSESTFLTLEPGSFEIDDGGAETFVLFVGDIDGNPIVGGSTVSIQLTGNIQLLGIPQQFGIPDAQTFGALVPGLNLFSFAVGDAQSGQGMDEIVSVTVSVSSSGLPAGGNGSVSISSIGILHGVATPTVTPTPEPPAPPKVEPGQVELSQGTGAPPTNCNGGSQTFVVTGGSPPFTIFAGGGCVSVTSVPGSGGSFLFTAGDTVGNFQVTVTDAIGRTASAGISILGPRTPTSTPTGPPTLTPTVTATPSITPTVVPFSMSFVSAAPQTIGVRGSGIPEQAVLTFRVTDALARPLPGVNVQFSISPSPIGGEVVNPTIATSDASGLVQAVLTSGTRTTSVRVIARAVGFSVFAQSTQVLITGAPPAFGRFSLAPEFRNISGRVTFGLEDVITAFVNDRFGNAVPAGTVVSFTSNGGSIVESTTTNSQGRAQATLISEGAEIPPTGIVQVLGVTRGEEPFTDVNGNGVFDADEPFVDIPEPFIDVNGNGQFDADQPFERFIDTNANGQWDSGQSPGVWDADALIWTTVPVTFSGPTVIDLEPTSFIIQDGGIQTLTLRISDLDGNPIVGGSLVSIALQGNIRLIGISNSFVLPDTQTFGEFVEGINQFTFSIEDAQRGTITDERVTVTVSVASDPNTLPAGGNGSGQAFSVGTIEAVPTPTHTPTTTPTPPPTATFTPVPPAIVPTQLTLSGGTGAPPSACNGAQQVFVVTGGAPPFSVFAGGGCVSVNSVPTSGGSFVYTAGNTLGQFTVTITDAIGRTAVAGVVVEGPPTPTFTPTRTPTNTPPPSATIPPTPGAALIRLDQILGRVTNNVDGSFTTIISALVTDSDGVVVQQGIPVEFSLVNPVAGVSVTSPGLTGQPQPCNIDFEIVIQPGDALSCLKYVAGLQGGTVLVRARVRAADGSFIEDVREIVLIDTRPTATPTITPTPIIPTPTIAPPMVIPAHDVIFAGPGLPPGCNGETAVFQVTGGAPPFTVLPAGVGCVNRTNLPASGDTFSFTAGNAIGDLAFTVVDSMGRFAVVQITQEAPPAAFIFVDLFENRRNDNGDGTFSSVLSALVTDSSGAVVPDGVPVEFSLINPVAGISVISPGFTHNSVPCQISAFTVTRQPGDALSCIKYANALQGSEITIRVRVRAFSGIIEATKTLRLPDDRPSPTPTDTRTPSPTNTPSVTPTRTFTPTNTPLPEGFQTFTPTLTTTPSPTSTGTPTPPAGSIQFVGASPVPIGVRGSGRPEQSVVTFVLRNTLNDPIVGVPVTFSLIGTGSESINPLSAISDETGTVVTTLTSGTRATSVLIRAAVDANGDSVPDIFAQSVGVSILAGPPTRNRFSVDAASRNIRGRVDLGIQDPVVAFLNDRFGNAVPTGTAVSFISNGSSVVLPTTTDDLGRATAVLLAERVIPPTGIVTVMAFTIGEETFLDNNGNGDFDAGDTVLTDDVPEPYIDFRPFPPLDAGCSILPPSPLCNDAFDPATPFELFLDAPPGGGTWTTQGTSGAFDRNIFLFDTVTVTFSGAPVTPVFSPGEGFAIPDGGSLEFTVRIHDDLVNPIGPVLISDPDPQNEDVDIEIFDGAFNASVANGEYHLRDAQSFNQLVEGLTLFRFTVFDPFPGDGLPAKPVHLTVCIDPTPGVVASDGTCFPGPSGTVD